MTEEYSLLTKVLFSAIYGSLSAVGITGNLMTTFVVLCVNNMFTPTNCYLLSLASSDLLLILTGIPVEFSYLYVIGNDYIFGKIGCRAFTYLTYLAINSSSLTIMALTMERYIGICHPLKARNVCTVERAIIIISSIWAVSLFYNLPWLFLATIKYEEHNQTLTGIKHCTFAIDRQNSMYKMIYAGDFCLFYLLPMLLYFVLYGKIVYKLSFKPENQAERSLTMVCSSSTARRSEMQSELSKTTSMPASSHGNTLTVGNGSPRPVERRRRKAKAVKLLACVATVFGICWLPYRALVMYNSFAKETWTPDSYIFFAKTMLFINCAINPILYNFISTKFRRAFRLLLRMVTRTCVIQGEASETEELENRRKRSVRQYQAINKQQTPLMSPEHQRRSFAVRCQSVDIF